MRRPKNATEKDARQEWTWGDPVKAMQSLRKAGYDEPARVKFLREVVGVTDSGLYELQLHRDRYLDWLEDQPKCSTIGCGELATVRISYDYRNDGETQTEDVCGGCADCYARRPVLTHFTRTEL